MLENIRIFHARNLAADIDEQNAKMRALIADSLAVLRTPIPDTFLGRQRHAFIRPATEAE